MAQAKIHTVDTIHILGGEIRFSAVPAADTEAHPKEVDISLEKLYHVNLSSKTTSNPCYSTCVLPHTPILMADGSWKRVDEIQIGEQVMGINGPATVKDTHSPFLGVDRHLISIYSPVLDTFLVITDDHPIWCRLAGVQNWGTYNYNHFLWEVQTEKQAVGSYPDMLFKAASNELAYVTGFLDTVVGPVNSYSDPNGVSDGGVTPHTRLCHLVLDEPGGYIAAGFVISAYGYQKDRSSYHWDGLPQFKQAQAA